MLPDNDDPNRAASVESLPHPNDRRWSDRVTLDQLDGQDYAFYLSAWIRYPFEKHSRGFYADVVVRNPDGSECRTLLIQEWHIVETNYRDVVRTA